MLFKSRPARSLYRSQDRERLLCVAGGI